MKKFGITFSSPSICTVAPRKSPPHKFQSCTRAHTAVSVKWNPFPGGFLFKDYFSILRIYKNVWVKWVCRNHILKAILSYKNTQLLEYMIGDGLWYYGSDRQNWKFFYDFFFFFACVRNKQLTKVLINFPLS